MENQHSTYTYTPLNGAKREIRLLHLLPKDKGYRRSRAVRFFRRKAKALVERSEDICCRFSLASLEKPPPFEALSYAWGDPKGVEPINLNGHNFLITENLNCALHLLHLDDKERILWVDALSINQADDDERTSQVAQMQHIFESVSTVVVFLGNAWAGSDAAMGFIEQVGTDPGLHSDPALEPHATTQGMNFSSTILQDHVDTFFSLPWFTRTWTVQEYILARRVVVQCGQRVLDADILHTFTSNLNRHNQECCQQFLGSVPYNTDVRNFWQTLEDMAPFKYIRENKDELNFLYVAAAFRERKCYNPRDKIYGLLGLANKTFGEIMHPDYNISIGQVYINVTMASIHHDNNLDILSYGIGERDSSFGLPSFVPDWTSSFYIKWLAYYQIRCSFIRQGMYNACGGSSVEFDLVAPSIATSRAIVIDSISETANLDENPVWKPMLDHFRQLARVDDATQAPYASRMTAYWQTLCGGVMYFGDASRWRILPVEETDFSKYQEWQAWQDALQVPKRSASTREFVFGFYAVFAGRNFFVSEKGYIGFGLNWCEKGDLIVIVPGGKVPYILRPTPDELEAERTTSADGPTDNRVGRRYKFMGDAYVHGIMNGEAYDEEKLEPILLV